MLWRVIMSTRCFETAWTAVARYLRLDPAQATALAVDRGGPVPETLTAAAWDSALDRASAVYRRRMYDFFRDNCHCFVAQLMNEVRGARAGQVF